MSITEIGIKILRKLKLFHKFNFKTSVTLNGNKFTVPFIKGLGLANLYLKSSWTGKLIKALDLDEKSVFIDVGVNIGQTLIQLKSVNDKVEYIGFEPVVACCNYTRELIRVNNFQKCTLQHAALTDQEGPIDIEFDFETDARASINAQLRPDYFKHKTQVPGMKYDEKFKDQEVSLIKIDVEGAEFSVLKGMKNQLLFSRPLVVCEVLDSHNQEVLPYTQNQADALFDFLQELNYIVFQLIQNGTYDKLIDFKEISKFEIRLWERKSLAYNDYLFVPSEKKDEALAALEKIKH